MRTRLGPACNGSVTRQPVSARGSAYGEIVCVELDTGRSAGRQLFTLPVEASLDHVTVAVLAECADGSLTAPEVLAARSRLPSLR